MIEPFLHITGVASSVVLSIATKDLSVKQPINLAYPPCLHLPPRCWTSCRTAGCFYGWHCYHHYLPIYQYRPRNLCFTIWQRWKKKIYVMKSLSEIHNCDNIVKNFRFLLLFAKVMMYYAERESRNFSRKFPCHFHNLLCYLTKK